MGVNFLLLGVQKGGTSSFFSYLIQHPKIKFGFQKEIHYFDLHYDKGVDWYHSTFPLNTGEEYLLGDFTPSYLYLNYLPERVFRYNTNLKFIVLLRNPVERAYSHYKMNINLGIEKFSFENALKAEKMRLLFGNNHNKIAFSYKDRGYYLHQITNWFKYFPVENFLFIESSSFFKDTQYWLSKAFAFLGIPNCNLYSDFEIVNKGNYSEFINEALYEKLLKHFDEKNQGLQELIGTEFSWT